MGTRHAPYHGCPLYAKGEQGDLDALVSLYRWRLPDPIWFHQDIRVTVQQLGGVGVGQVRERVERGELEVPLTLGDDTAFTLFERQDDYSSAAFWYQTLPTQTFPTLPDRALRSTGLELRPSEE